MKKYKVTGGIAEKQFDTLAEARDQVKVMAANLPEDIDVTIYEWDETGYSYPMWIPTE